MAWWAAIPFTLALLILTAILSSVTDLPLILILVPGTSLWAAFDSRKIALTRYKSGIAYGPGKLFFGIAFLWIIGFPWYLAVRHRILAGKAVLHGSDGSGC